MSIDITKLKTLPEQVYENAKKLKDVGDATALATQADTKATKALADSSRALTLLGQTYEIDLADITIQPEDFVENVATLNNEIFNLDNLIIITATPDNGTTVIDNAENCGKFGLTPLEQEVDGTIKLKVKNIPDMPLFVRVMVLVRINPEVV